MVEMTRARELCLKTIYILSGENRSDGVQQLHISKQLNVTLPTLSRQVKSLETGGFIRRDQSGRLFLTESGFSIAENIYRKELLLKRLLSSIGTDEETAAGDAAKMAHDISDVSYDKLSRRLDGEH